MTKATSVAAMGEAETDFNVVSFKLTLYSVAKTVPLAKADLKVKTDAFLLSLDKMKTDLNFEFMKNSIQSSSFIREEYEWIKQSQVLKGHKATYVYQFSIDNMELYSKIYNTLTSLEHIAVSSPTFLLKSQNRDKLNAKALKNAFSKVKERFESECKVLGLNHEYFEIGLWEATYSDSNSSVMTSRDSLKDMLELSVGKAKVSANLEVAFVKKQPLNFLLGS